MSMQFLFLLIIQLINSQILLNIGKTNLLANENKYNCQLLIKENKAFTTLIKYIIFKFSKESKTNKNEIYISKYKDETINSKSIYKLALFGTNKIIIPYDYAKDEDYLYIQINCYKDKKCNEEITIDLYEKIIINEGETLYINGYKENYIYEFIYPFNNNENNNLIRQITASSYQKEDFYFEIKNNKTSIYPIFNGFSYYFTNEEYKNCHNNECFIELNLKIIKPSSYIMIQFISIDNNKEYYNIELYRPITGLLNDDNNKRCFYIEEEITRNNNLFIDFMIEDELQSLIYEDEKNNRINLFFSQTIEAKNKFCIKRYYENIKIIFFYFSVYYSEIKPYIRNQSYLGLLYNGYLYKKILSENGEQMNYFPSEYNDYLLYFYVNVKRGIISLNHIITNNFPFIKEKIEDQNYKSLKVNKIGNEYFGTMLVKEYNKMSSSPMNPNKNILNIDCDSGVNIDEDDVYCEFNIMFYTQNDIIHLRQNEKFSFFNYDSVFNDYIYKLKFEIEINFSLISLIGNNNKFLYKLVIDTYSQFGSSYIDFDDNYEALYGENIQTFYNDNLISKEIVFDYDKTKINGIFEEEIIKYKFNLISEDYDFVSILISGNSQNENKVLESRLWQNNYILTTLSKRIPQKKLVLDNLYLYMSYLNYFRTFIIFKYINCDVKTNIIDIETNKEISKEKIEFEGINNNISYIIISKYLNKNINRYEFDINLNEIYDNEPVCMIYFSSFFIDEKSLSSSNPIFLKEDTEIPIIFLDFSPNGYNYEYLILNFYSPIIISISFEQIAEISLTYIFDKNIINPNLKKNEIIFHYSRNFIIPAEEILENCLFDENEYEKNIYRDKFICKLQFQIMQKNKENFKKMIANLKVRTNKNKSVNYLNSNTLTNGLIVGGQFIYYYSNIRQNDSGYIALNHKKGIGFMYARIINKNTFDYGGLKWNGRINLLTTKEQINKCNDCLIYDINTNEIIFTEDNTKNCNFNLRCQIIIGVSNIEDSDNNSLEDNIYEYSIYIIKNNLDKNFFGNLKIYSNEYLQGTLYENHSLVNKNILKFNYYIPEDVENIKYDLQCKKCSLFLILDSNKIKQNNNKENIMKYGSNIINFENKNKIKSYYNKIVQFEITTEEYEQNNYSIIFFKISLLYKDIKDSITLLNSEANTICYKECNFLIPIYDYDKLDIFTMSVSDINLKVSNLNTELELLIFDSLDNYNNIMKKDSNINNENNMIKEKLKSKKNYIIWKSKNNCKFKNIFIKANIKIINDKEEDSSYYYLVHFTYNKQSHKNYFLYPNRINLINIQKNEMNQSDNNITIKGIKFPDYILINSYQNKNKSDYSSIIKFNFIKGEGVVNLITNNLYLNDNIYAEYSELKTFIFDYSHSFFQINYNDKSKFSNLIEIDTKDDLYLYGTIVTNLNPNINEIKLGKTNYILYQYDNILPFILFLKINDINEIKNDIFVNIKLEGLEIYQKYEWYLTGYFINSDKMKEIIKILDTKPISDGFYDDLTNIGIINFKSNDMIKYYNKTNNLVLLIKLINIKSTQSQSIDIMLKAIAMPNKISNLKNENKFSIPSFEYYFSYLNDEYSLYNLSLFNKNYNYMSLELIFSSDKINYALYNDDDLLNIDEKMKLIYQNKTNGIKIVDERYQNGKRSLVLFFEKEIKEIYLIIFNKDINKESYNFFCFKYYFFSNSEFEKGQYLYKNRFILNNNEIKLGKRKGGLSYIYWEMIDIINKKIKKGDIKIDYYLEIFNEKFNPLIINNCGLFKNFEEKKKNFGEHLINKNEYELADENLLKDENTTITLIAKFNEINGMENYIIYKPLKIYDINSNNIDIDQNENNNNIKEKDKIIPSQNEKNSVISFFFKCFIILLIIILIVLFFIYLYKIIRRIQIKKIVDTLIENKNDDYNLKCIEDEYNIKPKNELNFNSKISYVIESL